MRQVSSFTPLEAAVAPPGGWGAATRGALESLGFTLPVTLGAVTLVFAGMGPQVLGPAVLATLLALAALQVLTARSRQPVLYSARFFEATTVAAMLEAMVRHMPAWGLADTTGTRLALLCVTVCGAGIAMALLYLVRADRFTRYIPAPVFVGFSNSIAVVLVLSLLPPLREALALPGGALAAWLLTLAAAFASAMAVRRWIPGWPGTACGLAVGALVGAACASLGQPPATLGMGASMLTLPVALADFGALVAPGVETGALAAIVAGNAAVLGAMMFMNTSIAARMMRQEDEDLLPPRHAAWPGLCMAALALLGTAPLSGSVQSSVAAARRARLGPPLYLLTGAALALVALSGVLAWVPLAAIGGALLCEAWFMVDRPSVAMLRAWAARQPLPATSREDLALVAAVTATAVAVNMVAAVFAGLLLGLVLFAARNARRPVRAVWTGEQVSSNCARSRGELHLLSQHAGAIHIVELERDLFFGSVDSLERALQRALADADCMVIDWSDVRQVDTSVVQAVARIEREAWALGVAVLHVEPPPSHPDVAVALGLQASGRDFSPDLDHALERAENLLLERHAAEHPAIATSTLGAVPLFAGLTDEERQLLESRMQQRLFAAGEMVVAAGAPGDELMVVLDGSASVLVQPPGGAQVRLAGVRRGAVVGEMAFLDRAPRSASVVAEEGLRVAVLRREDYDELSVEAPRLVQKLLANLVLDVTARLRHTNRLATARQGRH